MAKLLKPREIDFESFCRQKEGLLEISIKFDISEKRYLIKLIDKYENLQEKISKRYFKALKIDSARQRCIVKIKRGVTLWSLDKKPFLAFRLITKYNNLYDMDFIFISEEYENPFKEGLKL